MKGRTSQHIVAVSVLPPHSIASHKGPKFSARLQAAAGELSPKSTNAGTSTFSSTPPTSFEYHYQPLEISGIMAADTPQHQLLSATYASPNNEPFVHTKKLSAPPSENPSDKTAYLGALRKATATMQEQINKELTQRMEEDKTTEAAGVNGASKSKAKAKGVDESKEEDNYGEEVPEED